MHYSYEHMREKSKPKEEYGNAEIDALIEDGFGKQDLVEYSSLLEDLEELQKWCKLNNKNEFFQYFQDAVIGAYYRYKRTKKKNWSKKEELIKSICSALTPVFSAVALTVITAIIEQWVSGDTTVLESLLSGSITAMLAKWPLLIAPISAILACWLTLHVRNEGHKKRNYHETWVRHSTCHSRLRLAMSAFLISDRKDADYQKFVNDTFAVLEQNIDQYGLNLFPKGIAPRA